MRFTREYNCGPGVAAALFEAMNRRPAEELTPDLFSTEQPDERSAKRTSRSTSARPSRPILPRDLPKAITYLDDQEFDRLFRAAVDEAKRRGKLSKNFEATLTGTEVATGQPAKVTPVKNKPALTQGQVNAVRASFKAGVTPSRIARQFGLSQSDVRLALAAKVSKASSS
jgi:hypothetical protein